MASERDHGHLTDASKVHHHEASSSDHPVHVRARLEEGELFAESKFANDVECCDPNTNLGRTLP